MNQQRPLFERLILAIRAKRVAVLLLLGVLMLAAVLGMRRLPFESSIEVMLPDGQARKAVKFLTQASLADKVVISVERTDPALAEDSFVAIVDQLAAGLRGPLLAPVNPGSVAAGAMESFKELLECAPQLFEAGDLEKTKAAVTPEAIERKVGSLFNDLAKPSSMFTAKLARQDPLGIQGTILGRLEKLSSANLYDVTLDNGRLFDRTRNHLLLVFTTPVAMTDALGAGNLVDHVQKQIAALPGSVRADLICGHLHTVSNERILKGDLQRACWTGGIAFLLIFALVFHEWRFVFLLAIPTCASLLALPLAALIHGQLSYLVAGFGMVIIGITADYGIYVYVVCRRNQGSGGDLQSISRIVGPMGLGMATTLAVFVAFYFSGIEGYRQLATFALITILIAYLGAILILPQLLQGGACKDSNQQTPQTPGKQGGCEGRIWAAITCLALLAGLALISQGRLNSDITLLDGVDPGVVAAEKNFEKTWSAAGTDQGILAITGKTYEEVLQTSEAIYNRAAAQPGSRLLSFSILWRSEAARAANLARWKSFWTAEQIESVKTNLMESAKRHGFKEGAFQPFLDQLATVPGLREPVENPIFSLIKERFVHQSAEGFTLFSFFPDTPESTGFMMELASEFPGTFCISRRILTGVLGESIGSTLRIVAWISLGSVVLLTLLFSPTWRHALISLVPALIAVLWGLGVPAVLFHTLNICHITAAAVVFGICVDYGIYMTDAILKGTKENGRTTIILTTATSMIGAGVLLFTHHPVLFAIGVTLTVGMLAGHVSAVCGVPALIALFGLGPEGRQESRGGLGKGGVGKPAVILLLILIAIQGWGNKAQAGPTPPVLPGRYQTVSSVVLQYRWFKLPALGVISVDAPKNQFALVGLSQIGISLFELSEVNGVVKSHMPGPLLKRNPQIALHAAEDVRNMFFELAPPRHPDSTRQIGAIIQSTQRTPKGTLTYRIDKESGLVMEKRLSVPQRFWPWPTILWVVRYEDYKKTRQWVYPQTIRFKQRKGHYAITSFVKSITIK